MRPTRLKLTDFKSHADTDLDLASVHVAAITGTNGAGKSTLLDAIRYALYGPEGLGLAKRADTVIREGAAAASVLLEFDVAGERHQIERTRRASGKTLLELRRWRNPDGEEQQGQWEALTKATVKDTQAAIEQTVGATLETFLQSAFIGQGDASRFATASPAERKETLTQALDLEQYPPYEEAARARGRAGLAERAALEQRIEDLERQAASCTQEEVDNATTIVTQARASFTEAEQQLDEATQAHADARVAAAAGEQARQIAADRAAAANAAVADHEAILAEGVKARTAAHANREAAARLVTLEATRPELVDLEPLEKMATAAGESLERERAKLQEAQQRRQQLTQARTRLQGAQIAVDAASGEQAVAQQRLTTVREQEAACCPTCEQQLERDAREKAIASLTAAHDAATTKLAAAQTARDEASSEVAKLEVESAGDAELVEAERRAVATAADAQQNLAKARASNDQHHAMATEIERARTAAERQAELDAALAALEAKAAEQAERVRAANLASAEAKANAEADDSTARIRQLEADVAARRTVLESRKTTLAAAERDATALQTRLQAAQSAREQHGEAQAAHARLVAAERVWDTLKRAFGRDGIPAQVMRHARPQIEADTNDVLARMGAPYRVRIDLERDTKSGTVQDTLDITILAGGHERPFDLLSGGEQYRVNFALRIAISRLLAHRAGRRIETLVLDEPEGLDTAGFSALCDLVKAAGQEFDLVLTVSHTDGLEAACDTQLRVEKTDNGSKVTVAA